MQFEEIASRLEKRWCEVDTREAAVQLLRLGEAVLENWIEARGETPTQEKREGFRLLALHRQGAKGVPSFNACRETCRELAYHYNLLNMDQFSADAQKNVEMMGLIANHLMLFVSGKMQVEELGEFCCASRPVRNQLETS